MATSYDHLSLRLPWLLCDNGGRSSLCISMSPLDYQVFVMGFLQSSCIRSAGHNLSISKLFLLLSPLLLLSYSGAATRTMDARNVLKVGVILDLDSPLGDQMRMAIEIACQDANSISSSGNHYIKPRYINSHAKPLRAISAG
ncbi:hypothetical protein NL676_008264 [Syzygium grande]|nr:hypothetical protein NL676_008264 [Syzygium grande]